jgi:hypothetical protein
MYLMVDSLECHHIDCSCQMAYQLSVLVARTGIATTSSIAFPSMSSSVRPPSTMRSLESMDKMSLDRVGRVER